MPDNKPFAPYTPERKVTMEVTPKEKQFIELIRESRFGKFTVQKLDNILVRVVKEESIALDQQ